MNHHEVMKTTSEMQAKGLWRYSEPQPSMISYKTKFQRPSSSSSKQWASRWWCVGWCEMRYVFLVDVFFLHFVYFQVLQISCIFHVSPDLFGFPCFSYSHFVPLTCCNQGCDRQEYVLLGRIHGLVRGKDVRIVRYNSEISFESLSQVLHLKQLAISWDWGLGAHWWQGRHSHQYCHVVQVAHGRNEQFHHWQRHGAEAVPSQKIRKKKHKCPKGCAQEEQYRSFKYRPVT